jgi:hypothetical protein
MPTNPKRDAQVAEDAGLLAVSEDAPSEANILSSPAPETRRATPLSLRRQDRLDRERAAGEGMTAPPSHP